jgi:uncharacterized protein
MLLRRRDVLTGLLTVAAVSRDLPAMAQPFLPLPQDLLLSPPSMEIPRPLPSMEPPGPAEPPAPAVTAQLPTWRRNAIGFPVADERPKIAIVIDDMGATHPYTSEAAALPGPLTLAWFPFARDLPEQMRDAAARGHEALMHMPMQAETNSIRQTGPDPLRIDLPPEVNLARLRAALDAVPGVVGLNNHMGSVATLDVPLMDIVAAETRDRGMLLLDSVTIPHSQALPRAELAGVPAAARDIFIDHMGKPEVIRRQLLDIENFARKFGYAIAIGHPRRHTLDALASWLPTLEGKGFVLWPIAATVALRNKIDLTQRV